jgi:heme-degrading monooxygenase HmoA
MILGAVMLYVKDGLEPNFEASFKQASSLVSSINGYLSHELHKCIEVKGKYSLEII